MTGFVVGYAVQRYIINNVIRAPLLVTFLLTFGIEIILINLALKFFGGVSLLSVSRW